MRQIRGYRMKRLITVVLVLCCMSAAFAGDITRELYFPPLEMNIGEAGEPLGPVTIVPTDNPAARYGAQWLKNELKTILAKDARIADKGSETLTGDVIYICHSASADPVKKKAPQLAGKLAGPESFALALAATGGRREFVVCGADGRGALYGTQTLFDIFRVLKGRAPVKLEVSDRPEMPIRAKTGGVHSADDFQMKRLDWFARWRINAVYYDVVEKASADSAGTLAVESARRGIDLYGCLSAHQLGQYFKASPCPNNPVHVAHVKKLLEKSAAAKVHGLINNFDDIPPEDTLHAEKCEKCAKQKRYKDLAELQIFWLKIMVKIGRKHGINKFVVCPTPYLANLKSHVPDGFDTLGYFRKLGAYCAKENISVYHCAVRPGTIGPVLKAGVKDFAWWYNGVYTLRNVIPRSSIAVFYGIAKLKWGWEMSDWTPGVGLRMRPDALDTLRGLSKLTKEAWLCGSDQAQWGMYVWRPSRVEPDLLFRHTIEALFGLGSFKDYMDWEVPVHRCLTSLNVKVEPSLTADRKKAITDQLTKDARQAILAVERLKNFKGPSVAMPIKKRSYRDHVIAQMGSQARTLNRMAERFKKGGVTVSKGGWRPSLRRGITKFYRDMKVQNGWASYRLRYCAYEQKDGSYRRGANHIGCDLAMMGPSNGNWYAAGFIDIVLDGKSLETTRAEWTKTSLAGGRNALKGVWKTPWGTVTMLLTMTEDNGLEIQAVLGDDVKARKMVVPLLTYPATWDLPDKARIMVTAKRKVKAPFKVELDVKTETAAVFYDANYDIPTPKVFGPCALRFEKGAPVKAAVSSGNYKVDIILDYGSARSFRIILYDYAGCRNAEVLKHYRQKVFRKQRAGI